MNSVERRCWWGLPRAQSPKGERALVRVRGDASDVLRRARKISGRKRPQPRSARPTEYRRPASRLDRFLLLSTGHMNAAGGRPRDRHPQVSPRTSPMVAGAARRQGSRIPPSFTRAFEGAFPL
jgi:hypothetical protein